MGVILFGLGTVIGYVGFDFFKTMLFTGDNRYACYHNYEGGHGAMGDALTCKKCGFSKYPEFLPGITYYRILGRVKE